MITKATLIKHKKLVFSQVAAVFGVASLLLGFMRKQDVGSWGEQMAGSFLFFAVLLFAAELKLLFDWLRQRKAERLAMDARKAERLATISTAQAEQ